MSRWRQAAKVDTNQSKIVEALEKAGISVELNHDDIICGAHGFTFWYEIKNPELACSRKSGKILESAIRNSQKKIRVGFNGHYEIVSSFEEIFSNINTFLNKYLGPGSYYYEAKRD